VGSHGAASGRRRERRNISRQDAKTPRKNQEFGILYSGISELFLASWRLGVLARDTLDSSLSPLRSDLANSISILLCSDIAALTAAAVWR
jgi:hypothetical protein